MTDERPDPPAGYPPAGYPPPAPVPPGYPGTGHPGAGYPPAAYGSAAYGGDPIYPLSTRPSWLRRYLGTVAVIALAALYATVVLATADRWAGTPGQPGVQLTFSTATADGSAPTEDALQQTATTLGRRIADLELPRSDVRVDGTALTVIVPDGSAEAIARVIPTGRLYIRPVVHTYPVTDDSRAPAVQIGSGIDRVELIQQYKKLRQSTNPLTLYLAAQVTAQLCGHDDPLAGNDDPALPLVACAKDGKTVYILKPSIISGTDAVAATSGFDQQSGEYVVNLKFNGNAAVVWGDFTAANPGIQTAFVLDSQVVTAPMIREAIRGGTTLVSGSFTATDAKELASTLSTGALPLTLIEQSTQPTTLSGQPASAPLRYTLVGAGVLIALIAVGVLVTIVRRRPRLPADGPVAMADNWFPAPGPSSG
ncbi:MAG: hypothetical protein U0R77_06050 [Mycolicibacterium insubricum]|nr:hypothetical protein [Mycobacterium sp.]